MTSMLVIDTTDRALQMFTAHVTSAEAGLVVRPGLELPGLGFFAQESDWIQPKDSAGLPVLLIGDGYQARSSAGFVSVTGGGLSCQTAQIVGWLGDHGLRAIKPRTARLFGPVRIVEDKASTNSNWSTASAVLAGLPILEAADRRAIIIAEGQSDYVRVRRLLPADPASKAISPFGLNEVEEEHRAERFTRLACVIAAARAGYMARRRRVTAEGGEFTLDQAVWAQPWAFQALTDCAKVVRWTPTTETDEATVMAAALDGLPGTEGLTPMAAPEVCHFHDASWECELTGCVHSPRKEGAES